MKYIITESQYNKIIDRFLTNQFEPHKEKTSKDYPDSIFWIKDGEIIVEIKKSKDVWVLDSVWNSISDMFSLEYDDTKSVIKSWLEKHYKLGGLTPFQGW